MYIWGDLDVTYPAHYSAASGVYLQISAPQDLKNRPPIPHLAIWK